MTTCPSDEPPAGLARRVLLRLAGGAVAVAVVSGCGSASSQRASSADRSQPTAPVHSPDRVLVAYFSRAGESHWYSGRRLRVGNTQVLAGKTVLPAVTSAVSGLGDPPSEYARACWGARIGRGLAVRGERVRDAGKDLDAWLSHVHLT